MRTFLSQQKLKEKNTVASVANLASFPENLKSKFDQRNEKSKLCFLAIHSYFLLLIVPYLLTASRTPHTENNDKPVVQKLPNCVVQFFAQETPDDIFQDDHEICTPVSLANRKKSDQSEDHNERKVPRVKTLKSTVSLFETSDVQKTLKSKSSSKENSFRLPQEIHVYRNVKNRESQFILNLEF